MRTYYLKMLFLFAAAVILAVGTGCQGYGGKTIDVGLSAITDRQTPLTDPSDAVVYVVPIEDWSKLTGQNNFDWSTGGVRQLPTLSTNDEDQFEQALALYRVGSPPIEAHLLPYHTIYVLILKKGTEKERYWTDITPTFNGNNSFVIQVPSQ
jgi:hypothetical protein